MKVYFIHTGLLIFLLAGGCRQKEKIYSRWQLIEIEFRGPDSNSSGNPNPFGIETDVVFTGPRGKVFEVPAFYDGDGKGGTDGFVWKVRFSADENGTWNYISKSTDRRLNSVKGSFLVSDSLPETRGLYRLGRLEAVSNPENEIRYLKFREGRYWLKAGCDDPENFLGNFTNYNTVKKRKAAIDYLASKGINSLYIMTHTVDGDGMDVWPWMGDNQNETKKFSTGDVRFNIAKLKEWQEIFEHMQSRGMVVYMVLEDDSAWKGYDHQRYYREMIARFGYLSGLIFNINEEHNENYTGQEALNLAKLLKETDPFGHPVGIHNFNRPDQNYILSPYVDFTSIQTGTAGKSNGLSPDDYNRLVSGWLDSCKYYKTRNLMVGIDEGRPECNRKSWWSVYLSGGVWEAHVTTPYDRPMTVWDSTWTQLGGAGKFMEYLPFWKMHPDTVTLKKGKAFCLSSGDGEFAFYLPEGGPVCLDLPEEYFFRAEWWNPSNGLNGHFQDESVIPGGLQNLIPPAKGDWALKINQLRNTSVKTAPEKIILETDMCTDVDDTGALAVLHSLADSGEAEILAICYNEVNPYGPVAIDAINTWYNKGDIPVGAYKKNLDEPDQSGYLDKLVKFPHDISDQPDRIPDAFNIYKEILNSQPDSSITIISVGFLNNLDDLLAAFYDQVARKVKKLVVMGYVNNDSFNLNRHGLSGAAERVLKNWPGQVIISGGGDDILTGSALRNTQPENPVREAYYRYFGNHFNDRPSWDQLAVLYAVRGEKYFSLYSTGTGSLKNGFTFSLKPGFRSYAVPKIPKADLERIINQLITKPHE